MKYLSFLAIIFVLIGCDSNRIYEDYNDMEDAFWHLDSVQSFSFEIPDSSKLYNIKGSFRNTTSYPFYNLYFQYTISDSLGNTLTEKLKEVDLFDSKSGEPLGNGLGDLFDHSFILEESYQFPGNGTYSISFIQYMRRDTLPYILSVGTRVEYASN